ncbi:hypothetical protein PCANC_24621, partial [Puccinia coronata f. sp. avenae]
RAVLEQPCSTGGRTGTVRPKHLPAGRTGLSDQFLGPVAQDQPGPVGQICPTSWLSLRSDSVRPTTGRTRLFEHCSSSRVRPVNAGSKVHVYSEAPYVNYLLVMGCRCPQNALRCVPKTAPSLRCATERSFTFHTCGEWWTVASLTQSPRFRGPGIAWRREGGLAAVREA